MIKKVKYIILIFIIVLSIKSYSYGISISVNKTSVNLSQGGTATVTVTASDATGNISVSSSNASVASASLSTNWLENSSGTITIKANGVGNATITVSGKMANSAGTSETTVSKSINVSVSGNSTSSNSTSSSSSSSSNNSSSTTSSKTVKMITTSPVDFSGFKAASKGPYRVTVENDVKQLKVTVKYSDNSTNTITKNLQEGSNSFYVEGYNIIATRKVAEGEEIIPNTIDEEEESEDEGESDEKVLRLNNIVLDDSLNVKLDPNFDSETFEYTVVLGNDYLELEELLINAVANIEGATITIDGNKDLVEGENIVTITVEADGYETVWYRIKVIKGETEEAIITNVENIDEGLLNNSKEILKKKIIISILVFLIAFVGIIFIAKECYESTNSDEYINKKTRKYEKSQENEDDNEEYNLEDDKEEVESETEQLNENINSNDKNEENNILEELFENKKNENSQSDYLNIINDIQKKEKENKEEIENEKQKEDLEKIKDDFFSNDRIEFDIKEGKIRRDSKHRHGKGKHS